MAAVNVFISYRRDPDAALATLVARSIEGGMREGGFLTTTEGLDVEIYLDVQDRAGVTWPDRIRERLGAADIVVVVMGPGWLAATDQYHRRRIDQEDDWVRQELELALAGDAIVIPLLFDKAEMPPAEVLPPSIAALTTKNAVPVRTSYFASDVQPLLAAIDELRHERLPSSADTPGKEWPYPDPPLVVKPAPLSAKDLDTAFRDMLPNWTIVEGPLPEEPTRSRRELRRKLSFRSFRDVLTFMSDVGTFCDAANHHPRWENIYQTLWIHLSTWDIGAQPSHLDLMLAAHIDKLYSSYLGH